MASGTDRGVIVVTGAASALGQRVCALAAADPTVRRIVAVDREPIPLGGAAVQPERADLATADLKPLFEGADVVVHLAQGDGPLQGDAALSAGDAVMAHRVLDAASAVGATHVVLLSSATAYGAWANNPVPLTEDAPLRPNPGLGFASEKAEVERAAADWRDDHPGSTIAVLRPTLTLAPTAGWLARSLAGGAALPVTDDDPPAQFLHVDDLAAAVDLARRARLDGPRNVAPDGWVDGDTARALVGGPPRFRLPERMAIRVAALRWRHGLGGTAPALLPYTVHPWVVANDRLRADGWVPASSNEATLVAHPPPGLLRRQDLALASAVSLVGAVAVVFALARRRR